MHSPLEGFPKARPVLPYGLYNMWSLCYKVWYGKHGADVAFWLSLYFVQQEDENKVINNADQLNSIISLPFTIIIAVLSSSHNSIYFQTLNRIWDFPTEFNGAKIKFIILY